MAAKNGPPGLRRLMERARGHDQPAGSGDPAGEWPGRPFDPDPDHGRYAGYADPGAESEHEFMTEAREIMGIDQEPGA
jgi:hypothetical protein